MQLLYNSDSFVVVRFEVPGTASGDAPARGGFEIVDKHARKEIYLEGLLADTFQRGVQALVGDGSAPDIEAIDDFVGGYTVLAQQPVMLH